MELFKEQDGVLVKFHGDIKQALIPDHIFVIGENAFEDCVSLNQIKLSQKLTTIKANAFSSCDKLERVVFPDTIKEIEDGAFSGCNNLGDASLEVIKSINPNALI